MLLRGSWLKAYLASHTLSAVLQLVQQDRHEPEGKDYSVQRLLLGTHTSEGEQNYLMRAQVQVRYLAFHLAFRTILGGSTCVTFRYFLLAFRTPLGGSTELRALSVLSRFLYGWPVSYTRVCGRVCVGVCVRGTYGVPI
jgi:hypothetical protein